MSITALRRLVLLLPVALACALAAPAFAQDDDEGDDHGDLPRLDKAAREELDRIEAMTKEAIDLLTAKKHEEGLAVLTKQLDAIKDAKLPEVAKKNLAALAHYNLACANSLMGKKADAIGHLEKTFALGWYDWAHIEKDTDLDAIRGEEGFKAAIAKGKELEAATWASEARDALAKKPPFELDLALKTVEGQEWRLADHKGKVVIVNVWGTWHKWCRQMIPHFLKLQETFGDKIAIVGLAVEKSDEAEAVEGIKAFAERAGVKYPLVNWSEADADKAIPNFRAYPTTIFVDREGKVRLAKVGYHDHAALEGYVKGLLGGDDAPGPKPEAPRDEKSDKEGF